MTAKDVLKQHWGYDSFRDLQGEIIEEVLQDHDVIGLLPTGGGKSICFQVPGLMKEGLCLIISPLIALMRDQVHNLRKRNIAAAGIYYGVTGDKIKTISQKCIAGEYKFLYVSPERLEMPEMQTDIKKMNISMVVVDEAHCISEWGYDFRPSYLEIHRIRELVPEAPIMAMTATAHGQVITDITNNLRLRKPKLFRGSFKRGNLEYNVVKTEQKMNELIEHLDRANGACSIVYVRSRSKTENIANYLTMNGYYSEFYHAGMERNHRIRVQRDWTRGKVPIMISTNAFGMGIDKDDVRVIIHMDIPESMEGYFQEVGRAGRDGERSNCVLICNDDNFKQIRYKAQQSVPDVLEIDRTLNQLVLFYGPEVSKGDVRYFDITSFASHFRIPYAKAYNSVKIIERDGWITISDTAYRPSKIRIRSDHKPFARYGMNSKYLREIIRYLATEKSGAFDNYISIREWDVSREINMSIDEVKNRLRFLANKKHIEYDESKEKPTVTFHRAATAGQLCIIDTEEAMVRIKYLNKRIKSMHHYVNNSTQCRSQFILEYFGEYSEPCGKCDICKQNQTTEHQNDGEKMVN